MAMVMVGFLFVDRAFRSRTPAQPKRMPSPAASLSGLAKNGLIVFGCGYHICRIALVRALPGERGT